VGHRTDLDDMEKRKFLSISGLEPRHVGMSLYRLSYPGWLAGLEHLYLLSKILRGSLQNVNIFFRFYHTNKALLDI
jgi:hypothetical protein